MSLFLIRNLLKILIFLSVSGLMNFLKLCYSSINATKVLSAR